MKASVRNRLVLVSLVLTLPLVPLLVLGLDAGFYLTYVILVGVLVAALMNPISRRWILPMGVILASPLAFYLALYSESLGSFVATTTVVTAVVALTFRSVGRGAAVVAGSVSLALFATLFLGCAMYRIEFVRTVESLEPGMSRAEVGDILSSFRPGHPYGERAPFLNSDSPDRELWRPRATGFDYDHCEVRYDGDVVREVRLILD